MKNLIVFAMIFLIAAAASMALAAQTIDIAATVICGKTEQATPCVLVLNRDVPSYDVTVKTADRQLCAFKVERVNNSWQLLGERRHDPLVEVMVDVKDGSCTVFNPRRPDIQREAVPKGYDGLLIRTVEVKP